MWNWLNCLKYVIHMLYFLVVLPISILMKNCLIDNINCLL